MHDAPRYTLPREAGPLTTHDLTTHPSHRRCPSRRPRSVACSKRAQGRGPSSDDWASASGGVGDGLSGGLVTQVAGRVVSLRSQRRSSACRCSFLAVLPPYLSGYPKPGEPETPPCLRSSQHNTRHSRVACVRVARAPGAPGTAGHTIHKPQEQDRYTELSYTVRAYTGQALTYVFSHFKSQRQKVTQNPQKKRNSECGHPLRPRPRAQCRGSLNHRWGLHLAMGP